MCLQIDFGWIELLRHYSRGNADHVQAAINAALKAKPEWEAMPWQERAAAGSDRPHRSRSGMGTNRGRSGNNFKYERGTA